MNPYSGMNTFELLECATRLRESRPQDDCLGLLVEVIYRLYLHAVCCKDI